VVRPTIGLFSVAGYPLARSLALSAAAVVITAAGLLVAERRQA
jgi:hypothetical protein